MQPGLLSMKSYSFRVPAAKAYVCRPRSKGLRRPVMRPCHGHVHKCVNIHLRVHAQVLQVAPLRSSCPMGVGHGADAQLQAGAVADLRHHQIGHSPDPPSLGSSSAAQLVQDGVLTLHDHIHIINVDAVRQRPPRQTGMFLLTSTMTVLAHSHTAFRWEPPGPKLNQPCSSMGAT